jgi:hypothetical protein
VDLSPPANARDMPMSVVKIAVVNNHLSHQRRYQTQRRAFVVEKFLVYPEFVADNDGG